MKRALRVPVKMEFWEHASHLGHWRHRRWWPSATVQFAVLGMCLLPISAALAVLLGIPYVSMAGLIGFAGFVSAMTLATFAANRHFPHRVIGMCNLVTALRLGLVSVLAASIFAPSSGGWGVFSVAVLAFALDGLDGWLARRAQLVSEFGARFDMEVDSLLAITLAVLAWQSGEVGAYVLLLGMPRYIFGVTGKVLPWLNAPLPDRFSRKVVCVVQIAALLLALLPISIGCFAAWAIGAAALAVVWSFWLDIRWLYRTAPG